MRRSDNRKTGGKYERKKRRRKEERFLVIAMGFETQNTKVQFPNVKLLAIQNSEYNNKSFSEVLKMY